jgi:ribosomal protein L11 methyltransferase
MAGKSSPKVPKIVLGRGGQWLELSAIVPVSSADSMAERLVELGSPGVVEETISSASRRHAGRRAMMVKLIAAFPLERATERLLGEVRRALEALGPEMAAQASLTMQLTHGGGWLEQWKQFYRPFRVGRRLIIRPPWEAYAAADDDVVLTLNPGRAFGTGLHETTQLCLSLLETMAPAYLGAKLLDVGCGSGILSLAGVLFGFGEAFGIDLDSTAVRVARANGRLNHLAKQVTFATGSLEVVSSRFELVVVNILLEPIVAMLKDLHGVLAPHGTVILSGILASEGSQVRRALTRHRWHVIREVTQEEWVALVCEEA